MGVEVETLSSGDGKNYPKKGDHLTMHYTGTLKSNGDVFDSSVEKGRPFKFQIGVGQVCWFLSLCVVVYSSCF